MTTDSAKRSEVASKETKVTALSSVSKDEVFSDEPINDDSSPPPRRHSGGMDGHSPTTTQEQTEPRRMPLSSDRRSCRDIQSLEEHDLPEHLFSEAFEENIGKPGRRALHDFFYPTRRQSASVPSTTNPTTGSDHDHGLPETVDTARNDESRNSKASPTATKSPRDPSAPTTNNATTPPPIPQPLDPPTITQQPPTPPPPSQQPSSQQPSQAPIEEDPDLLEQERQDREYVERFWTAYDDFVILSLFTQFGIICRLAAAYWFRVFDVVFRNDSALFTVLPLNCLSCFVMGLLSSGESLMQIISTRFTPPRLQQEIYRESSTQDLEDFSNTRFDYDDNNNNDNRIRSRRRQRRQPKPTTRIWQPAQLNLQDELREVQLLALERRMRASSCLVLFPVKKEDVDVVENYFGDGFKSRKSGHGQEEEKREEEDYSSSGGGFSLDDHDLALDEEWELDDLALTAEEEEPGHLGGVIRQRGNYDDPPAAVDDDPRRYATTTTNNTASDMRPITPNSQTRLRKIRAPANDHQSQPTEDDSKPSATISDDVELQDPPLEAPEEGRAHAANIPRLRNRRYGQISGGNVVDYGNAEHPDLDLIISNVATGVAEKVSRISRVSLADGWDVGTSPEEKCEDLMLGLRDGLCGALSSFSSWISSMVVLLKGGQIGEAFVGLGLGIQLPIVAYRFGQHVAVYIFVWRCRRETLRDERRGYGIRLSMDDQSDDEHISDSLHSGDPTSSSPRHKRTKGRRTVQEEESEIPSVRAIITALFMMMFVAQVTSLFFFYKPEDRLLALSLLFSPLGVLTRWRLSKFNSWRPNFPIGTFACNIAACALAGTLGTILAGNPGPRERIVLVSVIAGFGGTLSSVARFIVEVLNGIDPLLFRIDGLYYAVSSVFWGIVVSFVFAGSVDWADSVE